MGTRVCIEAKAGIPGRDQDVPVFAARKKLLKIDVWVICIVEEDKPASLGNHPA